MPEIDDNTGEIDFSKLTLADLMGDQSEEKTEGKEEKPKEKTEQSNDNTIFLSRLSAIEEDNRKLRGVIGQLVDVLSDKEEGKSDKEEISIELDEDEFSEPTKVKGLVSAITKAVTEQVTKQIENKFKPAMSAIESANSQQEQWNSLLSEYRETARRNPDMLDYNLGMQYLNSIGFNAETVEGYYKMAKTLGLSNSRFERKQKDNFDEEESNVKRFPKKIESSSVDTFTTKKLKTLKDAINSAWEESA